MLFNLLRQLVNRKVEPSSKKRRRPTCRPELAILEDRLAPAVVGTLVQSGQYLVYTGDASSQIISISGSNAAFTIKDTIAPAGSTIASTVVGFPKSAAATTGTTGAIPAGVTNILINAGAGFDTITVPPNGLTTSQSIMATANLFDIEGSLNTSGSNFTTRSGGLIELNSPAGVPAGISSNQSPVAGSISLNGPVTLAAGVHAITSTAVNDGTILFGSSLTGTGSLAVNTAGVAVPPTTGGDFSVLGPINIGGLTIGKAPALTTLPGANNVTFYKAANISGAVNIVAENAITLFGSLSSASTILLEANQDGIGNQGFSQSAGGIVTTNATGSAVDIVVNTNSGGSANATVGIIATGTGGTVTINVITASGGGGAILDGNGTGALNVNTGVNGTLSLTSNGNINLDTSVANLNISTNTGDITIRNTGIAIASAFVSSNAGNIAISNNNAIDLGGSSVTTNGTNKAITLTTTGAGNNITLDSFGAITFNGGSLTINSTGNITDGGGTFLDSPTINLTANTGITIASGNFGSPAIEGFPSLTITAATNTGGIDLANIGTDVTIASAIAQTGNIVLDNTAALPAAGSLTISGRVSTAGTITLNPGSNLVVNAGATVASGSTLTVTAPTVATIESINGTLAANGAIAINGSTTGTTIFSVGNTGSITGASTLTIASTDAGPDSYSIAGAVSAGGAISINSALGVGVQLIVAAPLVSAGTVNLFTTNTPGSLLVLQSALISGTSVALTAGTSNNINLNGPVAATGSTLTIDMSAGTSASVLSIGGQMAAATGTTILTSTTNNVDTYLIAPSTASAFNFTVQSAGNNLIIENVGLANITSGLSASPTTFTNAGSPFTITFDPVLGYQPWLLTVNAGKSITVSTAR